MTTVTTTDFPQRVQAFDAAQIVPDALVLQTSTPTIALEGDANSVSVPYIDADDDAGFVPEGGDIDESDPDTRSVIIFTGKVAELGKISREEYSQQNMPTLLSTAFQRAVVKKANRAYIAQVAPTAPAVTPPAGLLAQGITDGGSVGANLDAVIDAVSGVEEAYGGATHVLANPTAWATLLKKKRGTGSNESLLGAGTTDAARALLSVPVLTSPAVPANTLIVLDRSSILHSAGQLLVATSEHAYFGSDSIGVRVTWRFGARVVDAERVVKLTLTGS